jgi:hypothetical protein
MQLSHLHHSPSQQIFAGTYLQAILYAEDGEVSGNKEFKVG